MFNAFCNAHCVMICLFQDDRRCFAMKNGKCKDKGTFIVKILNEQNSTWQGSVTWVEEQKTQNFRSALELIKMIDEALDEEKELSE